MRGFGELEAVIMDCLWSADVAMSVRDVQARLKEARDPAYTTVMTVLDNLYKKGWLERERVGRGYSYQPVASREEYTAKLMREALNASTDQSATFVHFLSDMSPEQTDTLRGALRRLRRRRSS